MRSPRSPHASAHPAQRTKYAVAEPVDKDISEIEVREHGDSWSA